MNRTLEQRRCREERDERIADAREQPPTYNPPYNPFVSMDDVVTALVGTLKKPVSLPGLDAKTFIWTWPEVQGCR